MNKPYSHTAYPRCHEINRLVKLTERHQQAYYRNELLHPLKTGSPDRLKGWKRILAALVSVFIFRPTATRHGMSTF